MRFNSLYRRLAEDSGDYPIPAAVPAAVFPELRGTEVAQEIWEATLAKRVKRLRDDPTADPSYCCERCEHLTGLIREAGGVEAMADHLIAGFEQQLEAIHR